MIIPMPIPPHPHVYPLAHNDPHIFWTSAKFTPKMYTVYGVVRGTLPVTSSGIAIGTTPNSSI